MTIKEISIRLNECAQYKCSGCQHLGKDDCRMILCREMGDLIKKLEAKEDDDLK